MKKRCYFYFVIIFLFSSKSFCQFSSESIVNYYRQNWLGLSLFQSSFAYEEPSVMNEKGINGGFAAEGGINLHSNFSLGFEISNWNGRLHYNGSTFAGVPVQTITEDYVTDYNLTAYFLLDSFNLSIGLGNRHWLNDLIISYRRKTEYLYAPIKFSYFFNSIYIHLEYDLWLGGKNTSYMSDVGGGRSDVNLKQNSGSGYGLEVGWLIPNTITTKIYLKVHRWQVENSEVGSDGVDLLVEPENNTLNIDLGIGLLF
jgi:hypothetical protein